MYQHYCNGPSSHAQFLDMLVEDLKSALALKQFEKARQLVSLELNPLTLLSHLLQAH